MARVFVIQRQMKWDPKSEEFVLRYPTVERAEEFGELIYLLGPRVSPYRSEEVIDELHEKLADFDGDEDYLLLIGNPNLIWWAGAIAAQNGGGRVRTLQWSGREKRYVVVDATIT